MHPADTGPRSDAPRRVSIVSLGCARNDVDSEELAGMLAGQGWELVDEPGDADVAVVNTCGFIEQAKQDSVNVLLEAATLKESGRTRAVVAVGCLAERYGEQLAAELPEADAVLGFDSYADLSAHLRTILGGGRVASHTPTDRRTLLPISPVARADSVARGDGGIAVPGHGLTPGDVVTSGAAGPGGGPRFVRARLDSRPWAPLKIASGCDRRCGFCAIPAFRGAFVSRPPDQIVAEARWLAEHGVREVFLVSENSTSYGKDLGDLGLLEKLLPELSGIDGLDWIRVSYLQPAEIRPGLLDAMAGTPKVVPYFDISFQHASGSLLRSMRRFGDADSFLSLLGEVRDRVPQAGIRSNVILGYPGETDADVADLEAFLTAARLDVVGVFGYSDEEGTAAYELGGKLDADEITARVDQVTALVEELTAQRAGDRIGEIHEVLVEENDEGDDEDSGGESDLVGRAAVQGPEVDGVTVLSDWGSAEPPAVGSIVTARIVDTIGIDLVATVS